MKILTTEQKIDKLFKGTKYNLTMLLHTYLFEWCKEKQAYFLRARGQKLNWRGQKLNWQGNGFSVEGTRPEDIYFKENSGNIYVSFDNYEDAKKKDIVKVIKDLIDDVNSFKEYIIKDLLTKKQKQELKHLEEERDYLIDKVIFDMKNELDSINFLNSDEEEQEYDLLNKKINIKQADLECINTKIKEIKG